MSTSRWFHRELSGQEAEDLLKYKGTHGSFLIRPSQNTPGDFTLSVRRGEDVTHVRIQNSGDCYDLYGGEKFATLRELVMYYTENVGQLKEKNGALIELTQPLNCREEITSERWFHSGITGRQAETLLMNKGKMGSFLVRASSHSPGDYVLSARIDQEVAHVIIKFKNGRFDVGGGVDFPSLEALIEHYKANPMIETSGRLIELKHPEHATTFFPTSIHKRVAELEKQSNDVYGKAGFWEEFEQLQQLECKHLYTRKEGARPENKTKNRYKNILPFDHTRVTLAGGDPNVIGSDYINANYISGEVPGSEKRYIATQGCLSSTVGDFWKMVWQQRSLVIVMTTNEVERGRNKCTKYWPDVDKTGTYGPMVITNQKETSNPHYILREFMIRNDDELTEDPRFVYHYHFKAWPDHGVPQDPGAVLGFLLDVNLKQDELLKGGAQPGPIVVHCSAGIGRTGTFIVIDIILNVMERQGMDDEIDFQRSIQLVRAQRSGMVQTEQQYKFVYRAIMHHIETQDQLRKAGGSSQVANNHRPLEDPLYGNVPQVGK